jgi:8-oxo-dGTP pyrophosphatase MutT (NUDIX family)
VTAGGEPVPAWLCELAEAARTMEIPLRLRPPASGGTRSAVLVLFAGGTNDPDDPDLLFIQRSEGLRRHAGQPGFPGGVIDAADRGPVGAALREAAEEVGVDPSGVEVLGTLALLELPRGLTPAQLAGGFGLAGTRPLSGRIEESFLRQIQALPSQARRLLQLAAADPSGDMSLVWRAAAGRRRGRSAQRAAGR